MLSIVIPIHNEEPSILPLYDRLTVVMEGLRKPYEIIFVDDASTDRSFDLLANLVETDARLKVIRLRRNFGQTAALSAGFDEAQGNVIISLDGDLQHAPEDIPALLAKIEEGYDIASGWRKERVDNAITRKIPSRIANWLMAKASGVDLRDFGTTFKAYRAEDAEGHQSLRRIAPLHSRAGEFLRRAHRRGPDSQHTAGRRRFALRPGPHLQRDVRHSDHQIPVEVLHAAHAFLRAARAGRFTLGSLILAGCADSKTVGHGDHGGTRPAVDLRALCCIMAGLMMFSTGLLGEVLMRTYFESQGRRIYAVREVRCRREPVAPA